MFDIPRCREWTPLATQQLRLRSLIQIVGYNIRPPELERGCRAALSYYYTLHTTAMSAPFYTSERIASPHPRWRELHSDLTQSMSSTNVVIRIWCRLQLPDNTESGDKSSDVMLQTWGVYFSGLRLIGANLALDFTSDSFKINTLIFQMHGGYFCSYKSLNLEVIPSENLYELNSVLSGSSGQTAGAQRIPIEANYLQNHRIIKESRSISPNTSYRSEVEYSKSHSPTERGFKQSIAKLKPSASLNITPNRKDTDLIIDADQIYEHSPELDVKVFTMNDLKCDMSKHPSEEVLHRSHIDLSETAENYDLRTDSDGIPKCRYLSLNFLKSEIRPSYTATKLQSLHLLQYSIKKKKEAVQEIKESIYKKSALEAMPRMASVEEMEAKARLRRSRRNLFLLDDESEVESEPGGGEASCPNREGDSDGHTPSNGPRLTLKLNDLLSYKWRPSPRQRSQHARLTRQLEVLRFRRSVLADERDGKLANIRRLKEAHARLYERNQDTGTELMQGYHSLSRCMEQLRRERRSAAALRELAARAAAALAARRNALLARLCELFSIQTVGEEWQICGVTLPLVGDAGPRRCADAAAAAATAAAAAYAAHCCRVAAALLALPLRYAILPLPTGVEIVDPAAPDRPETQVPLCARGGDATLFRYAMFLLNKCVTQLLWARGRPAADVRPTLANLHRLLTTGDSLHDPRHAAARAAEEHSQSLRSLVASERASQRPFNRFKDCADARSPPGLWRHRHSRSVGSCRDVTDIGDMGMSTASIMGSEPFLYEAKGTGLLKSHNSDSEISRVSLERAAGRVGKVLFTVGDQAEGARAATVMMSTSDGCQECMGDDAKRTCSEIGEYWPREQIFVPVEAGASEDLDGDNRARAAIRDEGSSGVRDGNLGSDCARSSNIDNEGSIPCDGNMGGGCAHSDNIDHDRSSRVCDGNMSSGCTRSANIDHEGSSGVCDGNMGSGCARSANIDHEGSSGVCDGNMGSGCARSANIDHEGSSGVCDGNMGSGCARSANIGSGCARSANIDHEDSSGVCDGNMGSGYARSANIDNEGSILCDGNMDRDYANSTDNVCVNNVDSECTSYIDCVCTGNIDAVCAINVDTVCSALSVPKVVGEENAKEEAKSEVVLVDEQIT